MADLEDELLEKLIRLSSEQFKAVVFYLKDDIKEADLPGSTASQAERAMELIRLLQLQDKLQLLESTLKNPAIKKLSSQSAANPIKVQVDQIVRDYTQLFVGRDKEEQHLDDFLKQNRSGMLLVRAGAGMGKTALLANWKEKQQQQGNCFIAYHFFRQGEDTSNVIQAYRYLLWQLYAYYELTTPQIPTNEYELQDRICHLLQEPRQGKALVILLDALDEATPERSPSLTLPQPLPEGLYVIASVRINEEENLDNLPTWIQVTQELHLEPLQPPAIKDWLLQAGNEKLVTLAQDETFVAQVCDRTEGRPLFLKYLIDELVQVAKQGEESVIRNTLAATPKGFAEYIRQQYQALDGLEDWRSRPDLRKIFYFLTIAKGELSSDDLVELMKESPVGLPWQVSRWFKIRELEDYCLFSFDHSTLAEQFAALPTIKANTKKAHKELINYCAHWQEHHSAYALRYYAEHLRDVKRWEELYAIARNEDFASTQQQQLPDEPDLPLKTVQAALFGAAEEDKAERMVEFVLVHAHRLGQTNAQESPLDALRSGSIERAWVLADQYEIERCILWYLLLAWELKDTDRLDEAQATLEKLRKKKLVRGFSLSGVGTYGIKASYAEYATYLLAYVSDISKDALTELTQRLLDDNQKLPLCKTLSARGHLAMALEVAESMDDCWKVQALADIAVVQAQIEGQKTAKSTLSLILETAQPMDDKWKLIAVAQAKIKNFDAAFEAANKIIENKGNQVRALGQIAIAQAQVGRRKEAKANLAVARDTARKLDNGRQAYALQGVAISQAEAGEFIDAMETAKETGWECTRGNVLHSITKFFAGKGDFNTAFWVVNGMPLKKPDEQSRLLEPIAEAFAQHQNFNAALSLVDKVFINQGHLIGMIAAKMAQVGLRDKGRAVFTSVLNTSTWFKPPQQKQAEAIGTIAQVQAELGQRQKAQATFGKALEIAKKINDQGSRDWALQTIAEIQVRSGDPTAAWNTVQMIKNMGRQPTVLIAVAQAQAGDKDTARAIIATALERADEVEDEKSKGIYLREIAKGQAQIGDFTTAQETAKQSGDELALTEVIATIAQQQAWAGKKEVARDTFRTALEEAQKLKVWQSLALKFVAKAQTQCREFSAALETAAEINNARDKIEAIREVAEAKIQLGEFKEALETIRKIQAEGEQAVEVLAIAAEAKVKVEGREAAKKTYAEALRLVEGINNDGIEARVLETIAKSQAKSSFGFQAIRTTDRILINRYKHLPNVAKVLAEVGDQENFKHLLIPCAYYLDASYEICGYLARLYPDKTTDIAKVVSEFTLSAT